MLCYNEVALRAAEGEAPSMAPPRTPTPMELKCIRQEVAIGELVENYYVCNHLCSDWN